MESSFTLDKTKLLDLLKLQDEWNKIVLINNLGEPILTVKTGINQEEIK